MVGRNLSGMQRKLRRPINLQRPRKPRWRVRQTYEDEVDEILLGLGTEKDGPSEK